MLYDLAEKHRQPLYVGFNRRHIPLYNQHLNAVQTGNRNDLRSLRWEKHRYDLPGDVRTFIFDDFIHPLDSVNVNAKATLDDAYITYQQHQGQLSRLDVQWQHGESLLHASMNRQFGITAERVSASFVNEGFEFDSFTQGKRWHQGQEQALSLKDWTPMLTSKGFSAMIDDWIGVINSGKLASEVVARNLASHQLAEALCHYIAKQIR